MKYTIKSYGNVLAVIDVKDDTHLIYVQDEDDKMVVGLDFQEDAVAVGSWPDGIEWIADGSYVGVESQA